MSLLGQLTAKSSHYFLYKEENDCNRFCMVGHHHKLVICHVIYLSHETGSIRKNTAHKGSKFRVKVAHCKIN